MTEREQEIRASLQADVILRRALDIKDAKALLKKEGYCVENLWHIDDVKQNYKCSDEDAMDILDRATLNEYVADTIFTMIDEAIDNDNDGKFKPLNN
jgi:hypothetical protein